MERKTLTLGFSPCPNDTFIFYGLISKEHNSTRFMPFIADVEELNKKVFRKELDVSKISVGSYIHVWKDYVMLTTGGAFTYSEGPIIVAKKSISLEEFSSLSIAIPGEGTTANMLLDILGLHHGSRKEMIFHEIMPAIKDGKIDGGVVIHEGRWLYRSYGLEKIADLGQKWKEKTGLPLPLGVIVIKRELSKEFSSWLNSLIKASIDFAKANRQQVWPFIVKHAQEMEKDIIEKHITAFVNDFSVNMGREGKEAIRTFLKFLSSKKNIPMPELPVFWDE